MQKIAKNSFISAIIRGVITGSVALIVFFFGLYAVSVYAQSYGGKFGEVLNAILLSNNWQNPGDGSVKNAQKLGGVEASAFVRKKDVDQKCAENQCIAGFTADGKIICH